MDRATSQALRRFIALLLAVAACCMIAIFLYRVFIQPRIVVTTITGSSITVTDLEHTGSVRRVTANAPVMTISVVSSSYAVAIDTGTGRQVVYVSAGLFRPVDIRADIPAPLVTHIVTRQTAYNATIDGSGLAYLDTTKRAVIQLSDTGAVRQLDAVAQNIPGYTGAQALKPIAGNRAIVLTNSKLYVLQAGKLKALDTLGFPASVTSIILGTNQAQASFAVGVNQTIYWYSSADAKPRKVVELKKRFDQLAVGGSSVIAYSTRMPDAREDIKASYATLYAIDPLLIDTANGKQQAIANGPVTDASVSPDGAYATIESRGGANTGLYDLSRRSQAYTVENPEVTTPVWLDPTHFVYGKASAVWVFDVPTRAAHAVGLLPEGYEPTSITYDPADKEYFVTTYPSAGSATIFRLSATPASRDAISASNLATTGQASTLFSLVYVDITKPTLRITTNVILNNPSRAAFNAATVRSRQAALDYLRASGVDPNKLTITYDPATL